MTTNKKFFSYPNLVEIPIEGKRVPFFSSTNNAKFAIENAYFAHAAYTDGHLSAEQVKSGWKSLTSKELPGVINKSGFYEILGIAAKVFVNGNHTVISIRGSDDLIDKIVDDALGILGQGGKNLDGYAKAFTALLKAIGGNDKYNDNITVTGHSLGGGAVNKISENPALYGLPKNTKFVAYASPYAVKNTINFGHDNEPIYKYIAKDGGLSYDNVMYYGYYDNGQTNTKEDIQILRSHSVVAIRDTLEKISKSNAFDFIDKDTHVNSFGFSDKIVTIDGARFNYINLSKIVKDGVSVNIGVNTSYAQHTNNDYISGSKFATVIDGMGGSDYITGSEKRDSLYGGEGRDDIVAMGGNDLVWGGGDNDSLTGGNGDDHFIFLKTDIGDIDTVTDFKYGDKIDLRGFDASSSIKGTQPLIYIGSGDFKGGSGQVRIVEDKTSTKVLIDANGDTKTDLTIVLTNQTDISVKDFLGVRSNHSYQVVTVDKGITWAQAKAAAEAKGGHLATITSAAENKKVFDLISDPKYWSKDGGHGVWLGGYQDKNATAPDKGWHWVTGEKWNFTAWVPGNPDDAANTRNEDKLEYLPAAGNVWNDIDGTNPYGPDAAIRSYVIEYDIFV